MTTAAIVGAGFIGPVHAEALRRLGVTVRGILGSTPEESQSAAQNTGAEVAYPDFQALLDDDAVDVVHIAAPNKTHFDYARRALLAGKHVVCEKPLAMNTQQTAELVEISQQNPRLVAAVNHNIRFYPLVLQAREIVQSGELGQIYTLRGAYLQDWLLYDTDWNWRLMPEEGGELRAIGDIGTHWMDLMHFVTGLKVKSLLADLETFVSPRKKPRQAVATFKGKETAAPTEFDEVEITTDDWGAVIFHYEGGARGTLNVSQVQPGAKNQLTFEIAGSKGTLIWNSERPNEMMIGRRQSANEIMLKDPSLFTGLASQHTDYPAAHNEGFPDTFKQLYRAVYGYIEAGDYSQPKPYPTFEDGHYEVVLCEAILNSHRSRAWVDIAE